MITHYLINSGFSQAAVIALSIAGTALAVAGTWFGARVLAWMTDGVLKNFAKKTQTKLDDAVIAAGVPHRALQTVAAVILINLIPALFSGEANVEHWASLTVNVYFIIALGTLICSVFNAWAIFLIAGADERKLSLKAFAEAAKYLVVAGTALCVLAVLSGKPPVYFISALGAAAAVLLIVFKDTLLGLTAGLTIQLNDIVRRNDWIEIPGQDVDGTVTDLTLTTVKIRNWDNSIACIPSYTLISSGIRNWRGMESAKARRIKRSVRVNIKTIRELDDWEIGQLRELFAEPFETKTSTNIELFCRYGQEYLKTRDDIDQKMTILVHQLETDAFGLPVEIYAFTNKTSFAECETVAANLIAHLIVSAPKFGLEIYQR